MTKLLGLLLPAMLVCGCTRIAVTDTIGSPISKDEAQELTGDWLGPKQEIWTVTLTTNPPLMRAVRQANGTTKETFFKVTKLTNEATLVWARDEELNAYLPFRLAAGDESVALLHPDEREVKRLAESRTIQGTYDESASAWVLSAEHLEQHLSGKTFWLLDASMPFVQTARTNSQAPPAEK
jgi:hypothetical protein